MRWVLAFILLLFPLCARADFSQQALSQIAQYSSAPVKIIEINASYRGFDAKKEVKILSSKVDFSSGRAWFLVEDGRTRWVSVKFLVQRRVAVAKRLILRGDRITPDKLTTKLIWVSPREASRMLSFSDAVNKVAVRNIETGSVIKSSFVKRPLYVKRGELVKFLLISGGVRIEGVAKAMRNAFLGDIVELRNLSSGRIFTGEVVGEGRVVVR